MNDFGNDILLDDFMDCLSRVLEKPLDDGSNVRGKENDEMEEDTIILTGADLNICQALPLSEVSDGNIDDELHHKDQTLDDFEIEFKLSQ
jgi:hypothetical protein